MAVASACMAFLLYSLFSGLLSRGDDCQNTSWNCCGNTPKVGAVCSNIAAMNLSRQERTLPLVTATYLLLPIRNFKVIQERLLPGKALVIGVRYQYKIRSFFSAQRTWSVTFDLNISHIVVGQGVASMYHHRKHKAVIPLPQNILVYRTPIYTDNTVMPIACLAPYTFSS